jgi:(4S)-4-hydroxy-5-phosphonooxypentane-2,3-dione isomerase
MIVNCVYVSIKSESLKDFIEATRDNHYNSVKEPGNLRFDILQLEDDPLKYLLYEAYESEEAAMSHKNSNHYLEWRDRVKDMMAEPRKSIRYNIIEPNSRSKW